MRNSASLRLRDPSRPDSHRAQEDRPRPASHPVARRAARPVREHLSPPVPPPAARTSAGTIRLAAGARLVPAAIMEPPFINDRRRILPEQAAVLLDHHLRRLAQMRNPVELRIARLLGRMGKLSAYLDLGFARLTDYAVERLGLSPRRAQVLLQMDRRLRDLPETARAFEAVRLSHSQVRLLFRIATPDNERVWLDKAARMNVRQLEIEVRRARAALAEDGTGATEAAAVPNAAGGGDVAPVAGPGADPALIDEDSEAPHVPVSFPAPDWLRGRWDWAVEIFRRTAGAATPVWAAAEGIAADCLSGLPLPVADRDQVGDDHAAAAQAPDEHAHGEENDDDAGIDLCEEVQCALEEDLGASRWAPPVADLEVILPPGLASLDPVDEGVGGAASLDRRLRGLIELRQNLAWHEGRLLRTFANFRLYRALGFGSFSRYCRENLGMSVRRARCLIALARRLIELPDLERAYRNGELSWVKASEIARVARPETEKAWIHLGASVTVRRLREEVALALADMENDALPWDARRGLPRGLDLDGRVQLCAPSVQPSPMPPSPGDAASAPSPASTSTPAPASPAPTSEVQMGARSNLITTRIRFWAPVEVAQLWRNALATCRATAGDQLEDWECVAIMLESFRRTWEFRGSPAWQRRYRIFERDGWRCRVPGYTSRRNLHAHHIMFRSRGVDDEPDNLVAICVTHHMRCLHSGSLRCHRLPDGLLAWELGTSPGGTPPLERYVEDVLWQAARATTGHGEVSPERERGEGSL